MNARGALSVPHDNAVTHSPRLEFCNIDYASCWLRQRQTRSCHVDPDRRGGRKPRRHPTRPPALFRRHLGAQNHRLLTDSLTALSIRTRFTGLVMGVKERRQRERTQVREKILDAALEFFAREGVEGVTMRALADAIEYSPPVIYAHFEDKDAIIRELCRRQIRSLAQAFSTFGALDPVERLRRIGYAYSEFGVENPSHFRFMFLTQHALPDGEELGDDPEQNAYAFLKQ